MSLLLPLAVRALNLTCSKGRGFRGRTRHNPSHINTVIMLMTECTVWHYSWALKMNVT